MRKDNGKEYFKWIIHLKLNILSSVWSTYTVKQAEKNALFMHHAMKRENARDYVTAFPTK